MDLWSQLPNDPQLSDLSETIESTNLDEFKKTLSVLLSKYRIPILLNLSWCMDLACKKNLPAFASELLHQGVKFYIQFAQTAAEWKATDVLEVFLQLGLWDINENISRYAPPLLGYVVEEKSMVEWFIVHGADPNKRSAVDVTPLSKAAAKAPVSTIKFLLDNGGDVSKGCPLHHAIDRKDDCVDTLELLLSYKADIDYVMYAPEKDSASFDMMPFVDTGTPLHDAIDRGKYKAVECLLRHGADINKLDLHKRSSLDLAKSKNHPDILRLVESYSFNPPSGGLYM